MGVDNFKGQKYSKLKKEWAKLGELFKDPEFPPSQKSLFYTKTDEEIKWKRPTELCNVPKFVLSGESCEDLLEGELGNRWFIAACSSLANNRQLFNRVVVDAPEQDFSSPSYAGIFRFQFWVYGKWTEVVIDDFLPTRHGKLVFCHSQSKNEFWSALLEKAYAKLFGDYESLSLGCAVDALVDFTGGVAERRDLGLLASQDEAVCNSTFKMLEEGLQANSIMVAEIRAARETTPEPVEVNGNDLSEEADVLVLDSPAKTNSPPQTQGGGSQATAPKTGFYRSGSIVRDGFALDCGLFRSHGYNIREVKAITIVKGQTQRLIRLQSPWQSGLWRGAWSNTSAEMGRLSVKEKSKLGLTFETEADFWMLVSDFLSNFTHLDVCHFPNASSRLLRKTWQESLIVGSWVSSALTDRAGGDHTSPSFLMNPQYIFDVTSTMDGQVMVSLEQNDRTLDRKGHHEAKNLCIGVSIMKVEENRKFRLHKVGEIITTSAYCDTRSIFHRTPLVKGRYVLVPTTKQFKLDGEFLLRLYNSSGAEAKELTKDEPVKKLCYSGFSMAVQVAVLSAEGLTVDKGPVNPFCVVKCEGDSFKTSVVKDTGEPKWNTKFIFYKQTSQGHKNYPITIQVMSSKTVGSTSLGEAALNDLGDEAGKTLELSLFQRSKKKDQPDVEMPGKLHVQVFSSENLSQF